MHSNEIIKNAHKGVIKMHVFKNLLPTKNRNAIMKLVILIFSISTSVTSFAAEKSIYGELASAQTRLELSFCIAQDDYSKYFYEWSCEKTIKDAIRAGLELKDIVVSLVVLQRKVIDQEALDSDINSMLANIGSITEENIDKVSSYINVEARLLAAKEYYSDDETDNYRESWGAINHNVTEFGTVGTESKHLKAESIPDNEEGLTITN